MDKIYYQLSEKTYQKYQEFLELYSDQYDKDALEFIKDNFFTYIHKKASPDILMQIYHELGIKNESTLFYKLHLKKLQDKFSLDRNILEIGSGYIPAFAEEISSYQQHINKGTITIYEPLLIKMNDNINSHKEKFTIDTDISKYDLLVGILPCDATETIIEAACKNNKDFYIAMCGCVHRETGSELVYNPISYQHYIIDKTEYYLEKYNNGTLEIDRINHDIDYPILSNKKMLY